MMTLRRLVLSRMAAPQSAARDGFSTGAGTTVGAGLGDGGAAGAGAGFAAIGGTREARAFGWRLTRSTKSSSRLASTFHRSGTGVCAAGRGAA